MVRFLSIHAMVTGSNPTSTKVSLRVERVASTLSFQRSQAEGVVTSRGRTCFCRGYLSLGNRDEHQFLDVLPMVMKNH